MRSGQSDAAGANSVQTILKPWLCIDCLSQLRVDALHALEQRVRPLPSLHCMHQQHSGHPALLCASLAQQLLLLIIMVCKFDTQ